ncbi:MAG: hypothetical protein IPP37_15000 [Saprospiraceae bacterium]|nr:hypothetical protein [Saprospiraceae bacterium]
MTISNKINPSEDLKKIWKLVPKNIEMEESPTRKAPALYAESSAFMVLFYLMMILAIGGDIYLASKILMKAGVSSLMVIISVIVDFFLAILSFILTLTFTEITCKNKVLQLELDSLCKIKGESENDRKTRKEENEKIYLKVEIVY